MMNVLLDTSPLHSGHAGRGIGMYTAFLRAELAKRKDITLIQPGSGDSVDILHYPFFDLFFPTLPFIRKAKKTVVTIHDVIPLLFPKYFRPGKKGRVMLYRQLLALRSVDAILTDSESSKKDIITRLKVPAKKVLVTYLAANPHIQKASSKKCEEVIKKYSLPKKYLLYVGDINYNKNIPQLIKSLKFLPDEYHLVCVGRNFVPHSIPEWQWIETQIALSDVGNRVHFITDIVGDAYETLSALYTAADVYIQPSLYEGFGLPVLEAMQCHTPVVCAKNSSLLEVGGEHVQFVETTAESIAEGVLKIEKFSSSERQKLTKVAYEWSQSFSWEKAASATVQVYASLMSNDAEK